MHINENISILCLTDFDTWCRGDGLEVQNKINIIKENYNEHGKFKQDSGMNKTVLKLEGKGIHPIADSRGNDTEVQHWNQLLQ